MQYVFNSVGASGEQFMTFAGFHYGWQWDGTTVLDGTLYTNLIFDIKMDPGTAPAVNGTDLGQLALGFTAPGWPGSGVPLVGNYTIPLTATNWTHVVLPINPTTTGMASINGIYIKMWSDGHLTNTWTAYFDNLELQAIPTNIPPRPPPSVSLAKPVPGLAFVAASGGQYDRQEIRTVGSNYAWYGASGPVSYSFDIVKLGESAPSGFTAFMHLVPGIPNPTSPDSDWHETNVVILTVANNADGSASATIRYKTNAFNDNGHLYDTGTLGGVGSSTPLGIWTLTFNNDTDFTITSPSGGTLTTNLPPEVVSIFKNASANMQINIGGVPGDLSRLGQMAVVTEVKITGTPGEPNLDSKFLGQPLDTNVWGIVASSANYGVQQIPTNAAYWVNWTLPAIGYSLETKAALGPGFWTSPTITGYEVGLFHYDLFGQSDLPGTSSGFFRLTKRVATQLQVLLPGETNAPNTTTGKIGTRDPQVTGFPFDLTVNACDATWHIVPSCSDTVNITSSDPSAYLPTDAPLVNGTITFLGTGNFFSFGSTGTWTITASDVTTNAVANGVSTPITISQ
jgi:hypothetical protein